MTRKERKWFKKVGWWFPEDVCAIEPSCEEYVTMVRSSTTSRTQRTRKSMRFLPTGHSIMVMVEGIICIVEHILCVYFYCNIQVRGLL